MATDLVVFQFNVEAIEFKVVALPAALDFFVAELIASGQPNWTRETLLTALKDGGQITVTAVEEKADAANQVPGP